MLIQSKSRDTLVIGRFWIHIDDHNRSVRIETTGASPNRLERQQLMKFLAYARPDVVNEHVATGWSIEGTIDIPA